nr:MAG TPA: hypothetical protein [Caudoviricetes sp.]
MNTPGFRLPSCIKDIKCVYLISEAGNRKNHRKGVYRVHEIRDY